MTIIPYSQARPMMMVGDIIGCIGYRFISSIIIKLKGGDHGWSHVSTVIRDTGNEGTGRVEVLEAIGKGGMQRNYLSKTYAQNHGKLFWVPMNCSDQQMKNIMELGCDILNRDTEYDYKATWLALFTPICVDAEKFNCSENAWYLLTASGRLRRRYDKKGREIAPVPGDFPTWAGVSPCLLDMEC